MKDIAAEAILFDMYYMAKDPVVLSGEKREPPAVETLPVTEATPQFQHFYFTNITCNGAEKAIFIRGIPEMHVKDVWMENLVMQADEGIDIQEASGIHLKNVSVSAKNKNALVYVLNSNDVQIQNFDFSSNTDLFFQAHGPRAKNISIELIKKQKAKSDIGFGADSKTIEIK